MKKRISTKEHSPKRPLESQISFSDREVAEIFYLADTALENLKACMRLKRNLGRIPAGEFKRLQLAKKKIKSAMRLDPALKAALLYFKSMGTPAYSEKAAAYLKVLASNTEPEFDPYDDEALELLLQNGSSDELANTESKVTTDPIERTQEQVTLILRTNQSLDEKIHSLRKFSASREWASWEARTLIENSIGSEASTTKRNAGIFLLASLAEWRDMKTRTLVESVLSHNDVDGSWIRAIDCLLICEDWRDARTRQTLEWVARVDCDSAIKEYAVSGLIERPEWHDEQMKLFISEMSGTESGMCALLTLAGTFASIRLFLRNYGVG